MNVTRAQLIAGATIFIGALGLAYASGYAEATPEKVDVQVIYDESGEVDTMTIYTDGNVVHPSTVDVHTAWRGDDDLTYVDPTP